MLCITQLLKHTIVEMVKLSPLRHFTVPAFARAAPTVQAANANSENAIVGVSNVAAVVLEPLDYGTPSLPPTTAAAASNGTTKNISNSVMKPSAKAMSAGREFWLNALKTLLVEFRRMHPDIALGTKTAVPETTKRRSIRRKEMLVHDGGSDVGRQMMNGRGGAAAEEKKEQQR